MARFSIAYDLAERGWSSFTLFLDDKTATVGPFGYCTDALGDLVRAALALATSECRVEVRFDGEPTEWCLRIDEGRQNELHLRIVTFPNHDAFAEHPDIDGKIILEGFVNADDFAQAVQNAATEIWDRFGAEGYDNRWGGHRGFPLRGLKALVTALSMEEPLPTNFWFGGDHRG